MLYDPKWEKPADVFSLRGLIAWLEKQNLSTRYSYGDIDGCLLARYFRAVGYRNAFCGASGFSYFRFFILLCRKPIPAEMNNVALQGYRTYGAALDRARTIASQS